LGLHFLRKNIKIGTKNRSVYNLYNAEMARQIAENFVLLLIKSRKDAAANNVGKVSYSPHPHEIQIKNGFKNQRKAAL